MKIKSLSIKDIKVALQSSAELDEILSDEEWLRCFAFSENEGNDTAVGFYDNGSGDNFVVVFAGNSAVIKGFDHESQVSPYARDDHAIWPGIYDSLPDTLFQQLKKADPTYQDVTFCFWKTEADQSWQQGPVIFANGINNGSKWLLDEIPVTPEEYIKWARDYYEDDFDTIDESLVHKIYATNKFF
ncbi:hypothetical protein [Desulfosediminicola sp.]|uniref:hypothetical protein n=1 Tax=Desulfosediminicola sp. TaxID=2886825 RepID=UPI003AF27FA9